MITIKATGDTTLHTAGKYCEEDILVKVPVGSSGGGSVEVCVGDVVFNGPPGEPTVIYYMNSNFELSSISTMGEAISFSPLKNSIIYITGWSGMSIYSSTVQELGYVMGTVAYFVSGDFILTYRG